MDDLYDGYDEYDVPCYACGASLEWIGCDVCGGEGGRDGDALMEEDPLWYDGVEWEDCDQCSGDGGWWWCETCKRVSIPPAREAGRS